MRLLPSSTRAAGQTPEAGVAERASDPLDRSQPAPGGTPPAAGRLGRVWHHLSAPRDGAGLAFFRVAFGLIMAIEVGRFFAYGWIHSSWIAPTFHFSYYGFEWLKPWPGDWMYVHFGLLGACALYIAAGLFYRVAMAVFCVAFAYVFLLDPATYLNHFYLIVLLSLLMIFVPAHRCFSLDARSKPQLRSDVVPAWSIYLLRAQLGLVYLFAGVAKLNHDWLRGEPMGMWLARRTDFPLIGGWFDTKTAAYVASYGALALDLLALPLLLWRRTRLFAFAALIVFHLLNSQLFWIGIFPWLMIAASTLFFSPDWPRRALAAIRRRPRPATPALEQVKALASSVPTRLQLAGLAAAAALFLVQVLLPLRHFAYPGVVHWTEEGHRFSWHMKLRSKRAQGINLVAIQPATGRWWSVDPRRFLTLEQMREMSTDPELLRQFSHHVAARMRARGYPGVQVRAWVPVSLNGRPHQLLVDPSVDLAAQPRSLRPAGWILPLEPPRRP